MIRFCVKSHLAYYIQYKVLFKCYPWVEHILLWITTYAVILKAPLDIIWHRSNECIVPVNVFVHIWLLLMPKIIYWLPYVCCHGSCAFNVVCIKCDNIYEIIIFCHREFWIYHFQIKIFKYFKPILTMLL